MDYDKLAVDYDLTRAADVGILKLFAGEMPPDGKTILDFGCGTGNFAYALSRLSTAAVYGVEPSEGMRAKAAEKGLDVRGGDHTRVPFGDSFFDFIYMTDVVHHVPDIAAMFAELRRVLKPGGLICVVTESHRELETRFWAAYFPTTVEVEKRRYPDIPDIVDAALGAGLEKHKVRVTDARGEVTISEDFVKLVENKGYSIFRLIEETDYLAGLAALKTDCANKTTIESYHGETLIWLRRPERPGRPAL